MSNNNNNRNKSKLSEKFLDLVLKNDEKWCKTMGFFNPYLDPWQYHLRGSIPIYDLEAYGRYPKHNFVYDKLFIAKSQDINCGTLENFPPVNNKYSFPIFIKPRWGHLSAASKNCFKIKDEKALEKYKKYKHMMWSDFIDGREGMTDFLILNGKIVDHITYIYSENQLETADEWKYIAPSSQPPDEIVSWVNTYLGTGYTGVANIQYRKNTIIEVGLRLARSGAYVIVAQNEGKLKNIYNVIDQNYFDYNVNTNFTPFYAFKCHINIPILYIWPQYIVDMLVRPFTPINFYEYYFEPTGNNGTIWFQFMHNDFNLGMSLKKRLELLFTITQFLVIILFVVCIVTAFSNNNYKYYIIISLILLYLTRFLNPNGSSYNLFKVQKQKLLGNGPNIGPNDI